MTVAREDVLNLQRSLVVHKHPVGSMDGVLGTRTYTALLHYLTGNTHVDIPTIAGAMAHHLNVYAIDTRLRVIHFLAQAAHETDDFKTFEECGGPAYFKEHYEGRADLGNIYIGDGARFHGRGIFQLSGRRNYKKIGAEIGLDLEGHPELAATPYNAVQIACVFWRDHRLNELADQDKLPAITKKINGGENGLLNRRYYLDRLKTVWSAEAVA